MLTAVALSGLVGLLIHLLVAALIFWLIWWALNYIGPPEPFRKVITVILVIVAVIYLINVLLGLSGNSFITF